MKYLTDELIKSNNVQRFVNQIGILPNPDKVLRRAGNTYQALRELRNDSHIWSCIQSRKSGTLNLDHFIDPNGCENSICDFVKMMLDRLDLNKTISTLLDTALFGFQVHEIIWKFEDDNEGRIVPERLLVKPQELFQIDTNCKAYLKASFDKEPKELPDYKFIVTTFEADTQNPHGNGLLSKCYWHVIFKNSAIRFWVNYMEKYGMPLLIGHFNRGASNDEISKLSEALAQMTDDTAIVTPSDIDIAIHEATRNSSVELFKELIKQCNSEISKTILSQTLTTEIDSGSYAAAQTHFRVRREVIAADSKIVEGAINQLINYAVTINFGKSQLPKFRFVINDSDNMNKIDRDIKLANAGVKFTKDYWMRTYGLSENDFIY